LAAEVADFLCEVDAVSAKFPEPHLSTQVFQAVAIGCDWSYRTERPFVAAGLRIEEIDVSTAASRRLHCFLSQKDADNAVLSMGNEGFAGGVVRVRVFPTGGLTKIISAGRATRTSR
jgi:hypothetical protein